MKRILLFLICACFTIVANAQSNVDSSIIYVQIPPKMKINDKIFVVNKTPNLIVHMVVALPNEEGSMESLGSSCYITPNKTVEIASFDNNGLKKLRGKTIAVKAKGIKTSIEIQGKRVNVLDVDNQKFNVEMVNSLKNEDFLYDFKTIIYEANHDLYIELHSKGKNSIMDF